MAKILITSGPTREYVDPIRFISNESSGRMGAALATAALDLGHEVVIISGPVCVSYPAAAKLIHVITTSELEQAVKSLYPECDGLIAAAAPCDFRPRKQEGSKIKKTGHGIVLEFEETNDILKEVSMHKRDDQWSVGFALETENGVANAQKKLEQKNLDLIILNGPGAMNAETNQVRIIAREGEIADAAGSKQLVAQEILRAISQICVGW